jgi:hypothetical protein
MIAIERLITRRRREKARATSELPADYIVKVKDLRESVKNLPIQLVEGNIYFLIINGESSLAIEDKNGELEFNSASTDYDGLCESKIVRINNNDDENAIVAGTRRLDGFAFGGRSWIGEEKPDNSAAIEVLSFLRYLTKIKPHRDYRLEVTENK